MYTIQWYGHSCFKILKDHYSIVIDPYKDGSVDGLPHLRIEANEVLCSHQHADHHGTECVKLIPSEEDSPWNITKLPSYHDHDQGEKRGMNTIHILEDGQLKIVHMGDIGCALDANQTMHLIHTDIMMIPIGGFYTISAAEAKEIVQTLKPKMVIPMHYRKGDIGYRVLSTIEDYLSLCNDVVIYPEGKLVVQDDIRPQTAVFSNYFRGVQ